MRVSSSSPRKECKGIRVGTLQPTLLELDVPADEPQGAAAIFKEVAQFPSFPSIRNGELFSLSLATKESNKTHGLHRFAAKYIPRVPAWALEQFADENSVVLDPFCGSGTTLVEALSRTREAVGIDCDPLACLIASAKTTSICPSKIRELSDVLRKDAVVAPSTLTPPMPDIVNFNHWFSAASWGVLQELLKGIVSLGCTEEEKTFFLAVFSSVVRRVSNADDQTQKTYVSGTLKKSPPEVVPTFWRAFDKAVCGLEDLEKVRLHGASARIERGDASNIPLPSNSVDLIITSPPYLDSVDYMYNFMLEYFWLGPLLGVSSRKQFNSMRRAVTGAKNPKREAEVLIPSSLKDLILEADISPSRIAATRSYCESMARHFQSASRVLKRGAPYVLVVGNSQSTQGVLPIHDALIRLAGDAGFSFEKAFAYRIRRHYMKFPRAGRGGIITMDWVITMRNTQRTIAYPERLPLPNFTLRHDEVAN